ncbi:hypothetical protein GCM10027610_141420 [Dactylosporangium cerinum]
MEEVGVLGDDADGVAQGLQGGVADVDVADEDRAGGGVVDPRDQHRGGGLAGAGGADERDHLAGLDGEGDALEHLVGDGAVQRRDVLEGREETSAALG